MQTPERLAIIGGGILLSTSLVFGLKGTASTILPKVGDNTKAIMQGKNVGQIQNEENQQKQQQADQAFSDKYQQAQQKGWKVGQWGSAKFYVDDQGTIHVGSGQVQGNLADLLGNDSNNIKGFDFGSNAQHDSNSTMNSNAQAQAFNNSFQQAQKNSWTTGQWGSAKFYVDDQSTMHVGQGQLSGSYTNLLNYRTIKVISLDGNVQAPQNSDCLFGRNSTSDIPLTNINHLDRLDTSQTTNMFSMFWNANKLQDIDTSHFDTSNVTNMSYMFGNIKNAGNLDLGYFNTSKVTNMSSMFYGSSINQIKLGNDIKLSSSSNNNLNGTYKSDGKALNLDGNAHPGTWVKQ